MINPSGADWRKSSRSGENQACVEIAPLSGDRIAVRDSKNPDGPVLVLPRTGFARLSGRLRSKQVNL
jgi:uncharacterized protein DUF397